ncbi:NAD-dependent epimerase/dehydratase family protein [Actinomadura parmotrematis]|uniref:UDP-glucose 4-epimerase n=1 Tax=Actinomadura parmotrematis TaxID=2864039 RepID=A0ABS7G2G4_9ACTN|nr:NAD-dependent epimerase/dehydratase family protein [Actinomadura parmotrematis]MBW8486721.1 NAD-dependent epimerase/dehydratase family protein [Actinomadura parmotrematis]
MRVLVTGAAGYVGYAVGRRLAAAGHDVDGLVRDPGAVLPPGVRPVIGDLLDPAALGAAVDGRYDGVCHLAARTEVRASFADPSGFFATNVQGTVHLLAALASAGGGGAPSAPSVVYGSTAAVYGAPERQPIPESAPAAPTSPYGASKLAAEQLLLFTARTGAIGATVLRTFNVAGSVDGRPDPGTTRLIPNALAAARGDRPHLEINGDGAAVREYLHVDDLAAACVAALEAGGAGRERLLNVGGGAVASVAEVVAAVERVTGRRVPVVHRPPRSEPPALVCDASAARAELGWSPARSTLETIIADSWAALAAR